MAEAKIKAVLSLDDVAFVRGIKRAISSAKDLGRQFAASPIKTTFLAGALAAQKTVGGLGGAFLGAAKKAATFGLAATGIGAAVVGVEALAHSFEALGDGVIDGAARMETFTTTFKTLLGSAEAAQQRMSSLKGFAMQTPFSLPEVTEASRNLEVLTHGALSGTEGLQMIGDVAAGTNRDFGELSVTIGRLFANLRSGQNIGDQLSSLRDQGAISPESQRKISAMAGIDSAKAWQMAQSEFRRYDGLMRERTSTWQGMMSNFKDAIGQAMAEFGKPLLEALKPTLALLTTAISANTPKIAAFGKLFAQGVKTGIGFIEQVFTHPEDLLQVFKLTFEGIGEGFVAILDKGMAAIGKKLAAIFPADSMAAKMLGIDTKALAAGVAAGGAVGIGIPGDSKLTQAAKLIGKMAKSGEGSVFQTLPADGGGDPNTVSRKAANLQFKGASLLTLGGLSTNGTTGSVFGTDFFAKSKLGDDFVGPRMRALSNVLYATNKLQFGNASSLNSGPHMATPLLRRRETRLLEQQARVQAMGLRFLATGRMDTGGPGGTYGHNDRRLAMEFVRNKTREKQGLDLTNQLIENLTNHFDAAWMAKGGN